MVTKTKPSNPITSTVKPNIDRNGNGINDSMESTMVHGGGTVEVPNGEIGIEVVSYMKNKTTVIRISMTIIMVLTITGNWVLFNQLYNSRITIEKLQTQLNKSNNQFTSDKTNLVVLQKSIEKAEKLKSKSKSNVQVATLVKGPSNPAKVLSSGLTLWEAKLSIESTIASMASSGINVADITDLLVSEATDMGTTLDEIKRLPASGVAKSPAVSKPSTATVSKPSTGSGNSSSTVKKGTTNTKPSTGSKVNNLDKNGNGIEDSFESTMVTGDITTVNVPNDEIGLEAN